MFSRRKWLLLLLVLPLFAPIETIKPQYKIRVRVKLNLPENMQTYIERSNWVTDQVNILSNEKLLKEALKKVGFSALEIVEQLPFIKDNLDIAVENNDTFKIELVATEKYKLKEMVNEMLTMYFDIAQKKNQQEQQTKYESYKQRLESLNNEINDIKPGLDASQIILEDFGKNKTQDDTQQLKEETEEAKATLSKLRSVYTEEHPQLIEAIRQMNNKLARLEDKQALLLREQKKEVALKTDYQKNKDLFDKLTVERDSLKVTMASQAPISVGNIISSPELIEVNAIKARFLDLSGKLMLGIFIAFGIGSLTEGFDKTIWHEEDIRRDLGIRTLGTVAKAGKKQPSLLLIDCPKGSKIVESFEAIRSNIQFINLATPLKTILYSSLLNQDDLCAVNLAIATAYIGANVCLINISKGAGKYERLKDPTQTEEPQKVFGLYSVGATVIKNLHILEIEDITQIAKQQASDLIMSLKEKFDVAIVDSPPLTDSISAAALATVVDGVILGAKTKRTQRDFLLRNYKILNEINARALGAILQW